MKIVSISFGMTKGLPNYSSIRTDMSAEVEEGEDLDQAFDKLRRQVELQCDSDPSWLR